VPRSAEIALLLLVSLCAGVFASGHGTRYPPAVRAVSALIGGQWAGHFALTGTLDHHDGAVDVLHLPSAPMATAHFLAAFVCAALILVAERLYLVASSAIRAVLTAPSLEIPQRAVRWSAGVATARGDRPKGVRCPRAPPLFA
jgi:hypothetical protein